MTDQPVSRETPPPPSEATEVFSDALPLAIAFAELLVSDGVVRGLIGPREAPRIWTRHLLNCAAVADGMPTGATVVDVGSGAGLPGLALAVRRPDLAVTLVEPMLRRTRFLEHAVVELGLRGRVRVVRGRADDVEPGPGFDVVTSRALAPLGRLLGWCAPLSRPGGRIVAMKGRSAAQEIDGSLGSIGRVSDVAATVATYGSGVLPEPATVVEVVVNRPLGLARDGS